jgi:hypothetical protein
MKLEYVSAYMCAAVWTYYILLASGVLSIMILRVYEQCIEIEVEIEVEDIFVAPRSQPSLP